MSFKISDQVIVDANRNLPNVGIITAVDFRKADGTSIGGGGLSSDSVNEGYIITNPKELTSSVTLPTGTNSALYGPEVTIADSTVITLESDATLIIT
tara:strand:+ start:492 stop:782 length:291 start_codon:yes stop_codon:yes gene_type:complete